MWVSGNGGSVENSNLTEPKNGYNVNVNIYAGKIKKLRPPPLNTPKQTIKSRVPSCGGFVENSNLTGNVLTTKPKGG